MVVMTDEKEIIIQHLPLTIRNNVHSMVNVVFPEQTSLKSAVDELEKQMIKQALKKHGSTRKAAKVLGVDQSTIVRKAQKYNIALNDDYPKFIAE
jgi:TyrR family helix-turn-helix protein